MESRASLLFQYVLQVNKQISILIYVCKIDNKYGVIGKRGRGLNQFKRSFWKPALKSITCERIFHLWKVFSTLEWSIPGPSSASMHVCNQLSCSCCCDKIHKLRALGNVEKHSYYWSGLVVRRWFTFLSTLYFPPGRLSVDTTGLI